MKLAIYNNNPFWRIHTELQLQIAARALKGRTSCRTEGFDLRPPGTAPPLRGGSSRTFGETPRRTLRCARIPPRALRAPRPSLRSRAGCKRLTKSSSAIAFTVSLSENRAEMISSACSTIVRSVRSASSSVQVRERVKRAVAVSSAFAWKYGAASGNAARSGVNDLRMARTSAGGPADPSARIIASASPESSGNLFLRLSK